MTDRDILAVAVGVGVLIAFGIYRLFQHFRRLVPRPDPWDAEIQAAISEETAVPVCHRCLTEQVPNALFCPKCGTAVGDYNNVMPWVNVFSEGEVLRNSLYDRLRVNILTVAGFIFFTLALAAITGIGFILLPFFWVMFAINIRRSRSAETEEKISNANESLL
jgi:hypothetical protein